MYCLFKVTSMHMFITTCKSANFYHTQIIVYLKVRQVGHGDPNVSKVFLTIYGIG